MNIMNLAAGTRLMWDAPEPYPGYRAGGRVIYPVTVGDFSPHNPEAFRHVVFNEWSAPYMDESEWLREPTEQELETLKWPKER
jgi:hypothetical protein